MTTLDHALDAVMQLPVEQQEMLVEIVRKRHIERRREAIAKDAQESIAAFHAAILQPQPVEAIIKELQQLLEAPKAK
ncbi:MAG: hypothetical protein ACAF41_24690 [Leptolyngbya sp. BL-A-14]